MKSVKHFLEHALLKTLDMLLRALPLSWALALGERLGIAISWVLPKRKRLIQDNLRRAFPEKSVDEIASIARQTWRNLGRTAAEFVRSRDFLSESGLKRVRWSGVEQMESALQRGQGVVLMTSHFTNWEILGMLTQLQFKNVMAIARPIKNPYVDKWINDKRTAGGMRVTLHRQAVKASLRWVREKNLLGLLVDQNLYTGGVFVDFFGRPAATTTLPALIHERTGAAVFLSYCLRDGEGFHVFYEPIALPNVADDQQRILAHTQTINDQFERIIRRYPANWFWIHNRWKRQPDPVAVA